MADQIPPQNTQAGIESYLRIKLEEVRNFYPDWYYIEIGIDKDHIHLHMVIPPKYSVSKAVAIIKKNISEALREKFAHFLNKVYWDSGGIRSDELKQIAGKRDVLVGQIQTKYGIAHEAAAQQVNDFETTHKFEKTHC